MQLHLDTWFEGCVGGASGKTFLILYNQFSLEIRFRV